ncbi:ComEC/Rec2 family competence protein [Glaciihabitans sp. INWT7]|uniref:ComEC/Rec2 family competence protein n=1 Tax=Glaciihabitans sp. INWT7 TaxID=2596912 RepID=UPI001623FAEA|nr:ComEC/Rec2 family competence protein [Glaciihabitans sp. INWT7]QNE47061.1 ComEC/Rec2 family competence protein [Glaciihabitans sp. INWT7]
MNVDLRLAVPTVVAWVAVGVLVATPQLLPGAAILFWVATSLTLLASLAARGRFRAVLVGLVLALAASALLTSVAATRAPDRSPEALIEAAQAGRFVTARAVVTETVPPDGQGVAGRAMFSATVNSVTIAGRMLSVDSPATVFAIPPPDPIGIGATVSLAGTLSTAEPTDQVAFRFFADRGLRLESAPPWYLDWANGLRTGFRQAAATLPGNGGDLLPGLAIGDTSAVGTTLDGAMKATSLSHLTAVSGANCAVVIALVMLGGAAIGLPRAWRIGLSVAILLGFVVLVTPEPSVLRAAVMAALVLAALARGRPVRGIPILALASLVLLATDPWLSHSYGFILSVLATGGLLTLSAPLTRLMSRWVPLWLAAVLSIPLAAQLACQPVLILLNPSIPTYGVFANVLAEPAAPVATVLGLIACVLLPVLPAVGNLVAAIAWLPAAWIASVATFFSGLPGGSLPWVQGAPGVASIALITALLLVVMLAPPGPRWHRFASIALALVVVVVGGVAAGDSLRGRLSKPDNWQIAACDVGQGDAVLVRSQGHIALVDTGRDPKLLRRCLDDLGISHIDLLLLSHWDLDHVGGTSAVFGRVTRAMTGPSDGSPASGIGAQLAQRGAAVSQVSQGLTGRLGELGWEVLWPRARLGSVAPGNDASVTLRFTGVGECTSGCLSSLFLGDLGERPQALMMAANRIGPVDVVKVAHHGSGDQNPKLYAALHATVGVIGVGLANGYGHPTDRLLGFLADSRTLPTRTDLEGMALLAPAPGGGVIVWTEHSMPEGKANSH